MPPVTYRVFVEYVDPGIYQLFLRCNDLNSNFFLGQDVSYANLKTLAGNILKTPLTWTDATMQSQDFANLTTGV